MPEKRFWKQKFTTSATELVDRLGGVDTGEFLQHMVRWISFRVLLPLSPYIIVYINLLIQGTQDQWKRFNELATPIEILFLGIIIWIYSYKEIREMTEMAGREFPQITFVKFLLGAVGLFGLYRHFSNFHSAVYDYPFEGNIYLALAVTTVVSLIGLYLSSIRWMWEKLEKKWQDEIRPLSPWEPPPLYEV